MAMPTDIGIIDLMLGIPNGHEEDWYEFLKPQLRITDTKMYPLYAKCIELDIPICVCTGICGPRVPSACQDTMLIDEVCWYFPELKLVMRHGAEPWADLAAKLLLKWPNLYYS